MKKLIKITITAAILVSCLATEQGARQGRHTAKAALEERV
jgi:hypothetical protein